MSQKKQYSAEFKAKLALEVLSGKKTILEISAEHKVPETNLYDWKDKLLTLASDVFLSESEKTKDLKVKEQEIINLHKIIGEITVENNFLKKKLKI